MSKILKIALNMTTNLLIGGSLLPSPATSECVCGSSAGHV